VPARSFKERRLRFGLPAKVDLDRNIKPENPFPRKPQFGVATAEQVHLSAHRDRIVTAIIDRDCAKEQTGHGSPMPQMVHGGPGRAGGGEELGGMRSLHHYMQRTALQGSPAMLTNVTGSWIKGAPVVEKEQHPFCYHFEDLDIGQTFFSRERKITLEDIEHFAHFTGDTFYAHMSEEATKGHPFFPGRVAHGYLLLSFAAGLFVDPDPGPVLAN
jgi:oxepin-CoA hydrolase/3-oxo-5,6-dehydrosuberyl-CoA semialdehyde dehydrogenase